MVPSTQTKESTEQTKNQSEELPDFQASLNSIVNRPLDPETIDTYADGALSDLIDLTEKIVTSYKRQPTHSFNSEGETEDAAFGYFGLRDIDGTLEHLIAKSEQIRHYDELIEQLRSDGDVIVPTHGHANIAPGNGEFEYKKLFPRLKTLLLILAEDFDLDVDDSEQISLRKGTVTSEMMRKEGYVMVEVPKLNRTILVCDEEGNATYVLDSAKLEELGISSDELINLTKSDLNYYLDEQPGLGKRLIYGKNFVANMIKLIDGLDDTSETDDTLEAGRYLIPNAPKDVLSASALADKFRVHTKTLQRAIDELSDKLGEVGHYRFNNKRASGYTVKQQETIRQHLEGNGLFLESAPKGVLAATGLAEKLGVAGRTLQRAIYELGDGLGEVDGFRFGGKVSRGYTIKQQETIRQHLGNARLFAESAPDDVLSATALASKLRVSREAVLRIITELGSAIGEVGEYKFAPQQIVPASGYTVKQQETIRQHLEGNGLFLESAPKGVLAATGLAEKLGVAGRTLQRAIYELGDGLGEVIQYKFSGVRVASGYDFDQQEKIKKYVAAHYPRSAVAKLAKASIKVA